MCLSLRLPRAVSRARTRHGAARWRAAIEQNKVEHAEELTLALERIKRLVRRVLPAACCVQRAVLRSSSVSRSGV